MCPVSPNHRELLFRERQVTHRSKRFIITSLLIGIFVACVIVTAGLGVAAVTVADTN
jgi:hypothetical protein